MVVRLQCEFDMPDVANGARRLEFARDDVAGVVGPMFRLLLGLEAHRIEKVTIWRQQRGRGRAVAAKIIPSGAYDKLNLIEFERGRGRQDWQGVAALTACEPHQGHSIEAHREFRGGACRYSTG